MSEETGPLREPTVAELADACRRGAPELRAVLSPIFPTLYSFCARRAADPVETEELLVEALRRAVAEATDPSLGDDRALDLVLRSLDACLEASVGLDRAMEVGLRPSWIVPDTRDLPGLHDAVAQLPRRQRVALGMRVGDGFPVSRIASVLGTSDEGVRSLVFRAVCSLEVACCPPLDSPRTDVGTLDAYISALLDGTARWQPWPIPGWTRSVLDALVAMRASRRPTPSQELSVLRRVAESPASLEHEVSPRSRLPWWLRGLPMLLLLCVFAAVWLGLEGEDREAAREKAAERAPAARVAASHPMPSGPGSAASERAVVPRAEAAFPPSWAAEYRALSVPDWTSALGTLSGRLFFVRTARGRVQLMTLDLATPSSRGRVVVRAGDAALEYTVAPDGRTVAVSDGGRIWLLGPGGRRASLLSMGWPVGHGPPLAMVPPSLRLQVENLAIRPQGDRVAFAGRSVLSPPDAPSLIFTVGVGRGHPIALLSILHSQRVTSLAWSPRGDYLLVQGTGDAVVLRVRDRHADLTARLSGLSAYWSPTTPERLLWIERGRRSALFGVVRPDGTHSRALGRAAFVGWSPDGARVIAGRYEPPAHRLLDFLEYDVGTGRSRILSYVAGLGPAVHAAAFAPDGRHVLLTGSPGSFVVDYTTGARGRLRGVPGEVASASWLGRVARPCLGRRSSTPMR